MATKVVFITTVGTGTYTIPSDFVSLVSVEAIGGGGGSIRSDTNASGGSGGGAYSKSTTMTGLSANLLVYYNVGAGGTAGTSPTDGGDSWFNLTNAAPAVSASGAGGVLAKGGSIPTDGVGGAGGVSTSGTGDVRNSGGNGATVGSGNAAPGRGGGGGAAGPGGNGGNGDTLNTGTQGLGGGGGGGASLINPGNNASAGTGGNGGGGTGGGGPAATGVAGTAGTGGGGGGATSVSGGAGGTGSYWTQTSNSATAGSGGGGGGASSGAGDLGGAGALYGGGSGGSVLNVSTGAPAGAQGIIVFTYDDSLPSRLPSNSGYKFRILNSDSSASSTIVDFDDMFVQKELFLDAGLYGWGFGAFGSLGNGNTTSYSSPIQIGSLTNWKQVIAGQSHTLAVKTDGTLWAMGIGTIGALGDGSIVTKSSPVQIGTQYNWKNIDASVGSCGEFSTSIKTDGSLWVWGANGVGKLGIGSSSSALYYSSPIQVGALTNWKQVSSSKNFDSVLAIKTDGTLWSWGNNTFGQLGNGNTTYYSSPIQIGALTNWKQVTNGQAFSVAMKTDGTLWAWGENFWGNLGNGTRTNYSSPIQVGTLTNWKQVAGGLSFTGAVKTDGTLWMWGSNGYGELGVGNITSYSSPVQVGSLTNWKLVSCGYFYTTAIKTDGTLWAWGYNNYGQLGQNYRSDTVYYSSPIQVGALTNWKQVSAGTYNALAISSPDIQGISPLVQLQYIDTYYDDSNLSGSYTFSNIPVTPGLIVVAAHMDFGTHNITSVNIEGSAATFVVGLQNASTHSAAIYQRRTTTSGNISVVVNFSGGAGSRCAVAVWRIYGNQSDTAFTTGSANGAPAASLSTTLNNLPLNSVCIAASTNGIGGYTHTWSGVTERYDSAREVTGSQFSGGDSNNLVGNTTITATYTGADSGCVLNAAAWR